MIYFTEQETKAIDAWLHGSTDYILLQEISYIASNKLGGNVPVEEGSIHFDTGKYNIEEDYAKILEATNNLSVTNIPVEEVRYNVSALTPDLKFTAPKLSFIWRNFKALDDSVKQNRRIIRFFLHIRLIPRGTDGIDRGVGIHLLKTGWYKIKSVKYLSTTATARGADARIEAIPWIYEYNGKLNLDPINLGEFENNKYSWQLPDVSLSGTFFSISNDGVAGPFWNSLSSILMRSKAIHDSSRYASDNITLVKEDSPCPISGPFIRLSTRYRFSGSVASSQLPVGSRIQRYFTSLNSAYPTKGKYGNILTSFYDVDFYSTHTNIRNLQNFQPLGLSTPMLLTSSVEKTLLSVLLWKGIGNGVSIVPDVYGRCKDDQDTILDPLDTPIVCFDAPIFNLYSHQWKEDKDRYRQNINDFVVEDSDDLEEKFSSYAYTCNMERTLFSDTPYVISNVQYDIDSTLPVQLSRQPSSNISTDDGVDPFFALEDLHIFDPNSPPMLKDYNANYEKGVWLGAHRPISYKVRRFGRSYLARYKYPVDVRLLPGLSYVADIDIDLHGTYRTPIFDTLAQNAKKDTFCLVGGDAEISQRQHFIDMFSLLFGSANTNSNSIYRYTFSSEWRPWLNIYDVISVETKTHYGEDIRYFGSIASIDANADTLSATYTIDILGSTIIRTETVTQRFTTNKPNSKILLPDGTEVFYQTVAVRVPITGVVIEAQFLPGSGNVDGIFSSIENGKAVGIGEYSSTYDDSNPNDPPYTMLIFYAYSILNPGKYYFGDLQVKVLVEEDA